MPACRLMPGPWPWGAGHHPPGFWVACFFAASKFQNLLSHEFPGSGRAWFTILHEMIPRSKNDRPTQVPGLPREDGLLGAGCFSMRLGSVRVSASPCPQRPPPQGKSCCSALLSAGRPPEPPLPALDTPLRAASHWFLSFAHRADGLGTGRSEAG